MVVRRWLPLPLMMLTLVAAGCGDEKTANDVNDKGSNVTQTSSTDAQSGATTVDEIAAQVGTDLDKAPNIPTNVKGEPPTEMVQKDIVEGKGTAAKLNDTIEVRYTLVVWGGEKADSSWDRTPNTTSFPLQKGGLIEGWIKGIPGMKPGGRRLLVVPPDLGYGAQGAGGAIGPDATLIFVVDLVKAN